MATKKAKRDKIQEQFTSDLGKSQSNYYQYFPSQPLPEIDPSRGSETNYLGAIRFGYADPNQAGFAGKVTPTEQSLINMYKKQANTASNPSAAVSYLTDVYKKFPNLFEKDLTKSWTPQNSPYHSDLSDLRKDYRTEYNTAKKGIFATNKDMADIRKRFQGGLKGYTSRENQAFREQANRDIESTYGTDAARMKSDMAKYGVRGASAMAQLRNANRSKLAAKDDFTQKLFTANADEKYNRLKDYSSFIGGVEGEDASRRSNTLANMAGYTTGQEQNAYERQKAAEQERYARAKDDLANYGTQLWKQTDYYNTRGDTARNNYADYLTNRSDTAYGRGQEAIGKYEDTLNKTKEDELNKILFNIGQQEKTQGRDVGGIMGLLEILNTMRNNDEQNKVMAQY